MEQNFTVTPIATIQNDFVDKFGIPRQSGLTHIESKIVFEPKYRIKEALKGIEGYSHLWLLWEFSEVRKTSWNPTVRPPRLGGNKRIGVFATRSPFRPNAIGLSCVRLERLETTKEYGTVLVVSGADLMNGTPILDIKPYIAYTDSHPEAVCGFTDAVDFHSVEVYCPSELLAKIPVEKQQVILDILKNDPKPAYQKNPERVYGLQHGIYEIKFRVNGEILTVESVDIIANKSIE